MNLIQIKSESLYRYPSLQVINWNGRISRRKWHSSIEASLKTLYLSAVKGKKQICVSRGESRSMESISTSSLRSLPFHRHQGHLVFPHTICPPITSLSNHISSTNLMESPSGTSWFRSHFHQPFDESVYVSHKSTLRDDPPSKKMRTLEIEIEAWVLFCEKKRYSIHILCILGLSLN